MRSLILTLLLAATSAQAGPYFRLIDPAHPQKIIGVFIDPSTPGDTAIGSAIPLITHSTRDNCLLPTIVCEDWSPLIVGFSINGGRAKFNIGPAFNLTPTIKMALWHVLNAFTESGTMTEVKSLLSSNPANGPNTSFSFGPSLGVSPIEHGVIIPINSWRGRFHIFTGASLQF